MRKAGYEILPDGEGYFGSIPDLQGVWANADTLEVCRKELREVVEEWILIGLKMGHSIPQIDGTERLLCTENIRWHGFLKLQP